MSDNESKTNPGVKDLSVQGIEPQSTSPQPVVIAMTFDDPLPFLVEIYFISKY